MALIRLFLLITILVLFAIGCADEDLTENDVAFSKDLEDFEEVIDYSDIAIPIDYPSQREHFIEFNRDQLEIRDSYHRFNELTPGKVLVSSYENYDPNHYFIKKIVDVLKKENSILLKVEEARLDEAFDLLRFKRNGNGFFKSNATEYELYSIRIPKGKIYGDKKLGDQIDLGQKCKAGSILYGIFAESKIEYLEEVNVPRSDGILVTRMTITYRDKHAIDIEYNAGVTCLFEPKKALEIPLHALSEITVKPFITVSVNGKGGISFGHLSKTKFVAEYDPMALSPYLASVEHDTITTDNFYADLRVEAGLELCIGAEAKVGIGASQELDSGADDEEEGIFFGAKTIIKGCIGARERVSGQGGIELECYTEVSADLDGVVEFKFPGLDKVEAGVGLFDFKVKEKLNFCENVSYDPCDLNIDESDLVVRCANNWVFVEGNIIANCENRSRICQTALNNRRFEVYLNDEIVGNLLDDVSQFTYNSKFKTVSIPFTETITIKIVDREDPDKCTRILQFFKDDFDCDMDGPCEGDFIIDHNGVPYKAEAYGADVWITENLIASGGHTHPSDQSSQEPRKGLLYSWREVMNDKEIDKVIDETLESNNLIRGVTESSFNELYERDQGICPEGYHVPSRNEWRSLFNYFSNRYPEKKIQDVFTDPEFDFCAPVNRGSLVGLDDGTSKSVENETVFWSSTIAPFLADGTDFGQFYAFHLTVDGFRERTDFHISKYSCRCIKDN